MTQFTRSNLTQDGLYVRYNDQVIARFKRGGTATFITFLIKNFTVEEYFTLQESGLQPLQIAESRGYLLPHIRKWLKEAGLPVTPAGFRMLVEQNLAKRGCN